MIRMIPVEVEAVMHRPEFVAVAEAVALGLRERGQDDDLEAADALETFAARRWQEREAVPCRDSL